MSETLTVTGTVQKITPKTNRAGEPTGWTEVAIDVGRTYPVKLETKKDALIAAARSVGTEQATFTYTERDSGSINPNNNQPYKNRYLEGVTPTAGGVPTTPPQAPAAVSNSTYSPPPSGPAHSQPLATNGVLDKDRAIIRQTCLKAVCDLMQGVLPPEPTDAQISHVLRTAARLEEWVYRVESHARASTGTDQ